MAQPAASTTTNVFISYRRVDSDVVILERVLGSLKNLEREGLVSTWCDRENKAGEAWEDNILAAIDRADIAVLLVSFDFYSSDFIHDVELPRLLARRDLGLTAILPLFLSRFDEDHPIGYTDALGQPQSKRLSELQGLPEPDKTLAGYDRPGQDQVLVQLVKRIRELATARTATQVGDAAPYLPATTAASEPPFSPADQDRLTLRLVSDGQGLVVHYSLAGQAARRPSGPAGRPLDPRTLAADGQGPTGATLFDLLFGPPPTGCPCSARCSATARRTPNPPRPEARCGCPSPPTTRLCWRCPGSNSRSRASGSSNTAGASPPPAPPPRRGNWRAGQAAASWSSPPRAKTPPSPVSSTICGRGGPGPNPRPTGPTTLPS